MPKLTLTELEGWDGVVELAGQDNVPSQGKAKAEASKRLTFAVANLGANILDAQKHISQRLNNLNSKINESSIQSAKLSKRTFWLTIALVVATIVQAIATVKVATK